MEKLPFRCYINFSGNASLLDTCIESLLPQLKEFSSIENPICILNNTNTKLSEWLTIKEGWEELHPPVPLVWSEAHNYLIKLAHNNNEPFLMTIHTDVVLLEGAMEELINKYKSFSTENPKWHIIAFNECFAIQNHNFFYDENLFYDAFLFPMYFADNVIAYLASLRGYKEHMAYSEKVDHRNKSHTIRDNPVMGKKNSLGFGYSSQAYQAIFGGSPGHETNKDPFASGYCYQLNERYYNYIED